MKEGVYPTDITDLYTISNNTFIAKDTKDSDNKFETEIGDLSSNEFQPQIKIKRWDNECNLSVRLIDDDIDIPRVETDKKTIKFLKNNIEAQFYDVPETEDIPDCYEFEVILKNKPKTNKIQFSIETKGLILYYQPALTQDEIDAGMERPENVIGSYAVFHENKSGDCSKVGGNNYAAGKAFHIYRPKIIDNLGMEAWGILNIDIEKKLLTIEIPQTFLDSAAYPVVVDPTFGYTTVGGTGDVVASDYMLGSVFAGAVGLGTSMTAYIASENGTNEGKYALYKHSDSTKVTNGETAEYTNIPAAYGWRTLNFSTKPVLEVINYVIVFGFDAAASPDRTLIKYDAGAANQGHYEVITYPTFPATATFGHTNRKYSIYCTYTGIHPWFYRRNQ